MSEQVEYVVMAEMGEYSDLLVWPVRVCPDMASAIAFTEEISAQARECHTRSLAANIEEDDFRLPKFWPELDRATWDEAMKDPYPWVVSHAENYTPSTYYVVEVPRLTATVESEGP